MIKLNKNQVNQWEILEIKYNNYKDPIKSKIH